MCDAKWFITFVIFRRNIPASQFHFRIANKFSSNMERWTEHRNYCHSTETFADSVVQASTSLSSWRFFPIFYSQSASITTCLSFKWTSKFFTDQNPNSCVWNSRACFHKCMNMKMFLILRLKQRHRLNLYLLRTFCKNKTCIYTSFAHIETEDCKFWVNYSNL